MRIWLFDNHSGCPAEAHLTRMTDEHVEQINTTWVPEFQRRQSAHERDEDFVMWSRGTKYLDLVTDREGVRGFIVERESSSQGVLVLHDKGDASRIEAGERVLTIQYVATAPWNRRTGKEPGRFRRVGSLLVCEAVRESRAIGHGGRVGLHALLGSNQFYRRLGFRDFGPDPTSRGMYYFEIERTAGDRLVKRCTDWCGSELVEFTEKSS